VTTVFCARVSVVAGLAGKCAFQGLGITLVIGAFRIVVAKRWIEAAILWITEINGARVGVFARDFGICTGSGVFVT